MFDHVFLDSVEPLSVFIPEGFGHGFSVLSDTATVLYLQSENLMKNLIQEYTMTQQELIGKFRIQLYPKKTLSL